MVENPACKICGGTTREAFRHRVLGATEASYRHCAACGFLFAFQPDWLDRAYSTAIATADTGLVARNLDIADKLAAILYAFFDIRGRFLDLAGGTGLLVRLMRDRGFDYYWHDPHCANVLAAGFEAPREETFEVVSAFEALEHMEDPVAFVADALNRSRTRTLVFATELHDGTPPPPDWWYYAFGTGQHIAFFARRTLERVAERLGCRVVSARGMHLMSARSIGQREYNFAMRKAMRAWYRWRVRRALPSRIEADHRLLLDPDRSPRA